MIRVLRTNGTIEDVPRAQSAEVKGKEVVCLDRKGIIVARYPSASVTLFGEHLPSPAAEDPQDGTAAG